METLIVSNTLKSAELHQLIADEMQKKNIEIVKKPEPAGSKALDPDILVALISGGFQMLTLVVNTLIVVWATKRKEKEGVVKIKHTLPKTNEILEFEFPMSMSLEERNRIMREAEYSTINRIHIVEK